MREKFHPLGAQGALLERLAEFTSSRHDKGLILAHPSGAGKTYAYLAYFAERMLARNRSFHKPHADTLKLIASEKEVHSAARETCQLLDRILEERRGEVKYGSSSAQFRAVKHAWLTLTPGKSIEYSTSELISAYSCGTTLLHSVFTKRIFEELELAENGARILVLCGGSGAELVGLKLVEDLQVDKLTVLDIFEWDGACEKIWRNKGTLEFQCMDLLLPDNQKRIAAYVKESDVVTLLYGLTELYDHQAEGAELLVNTVINNLQPKSKFVVLDPTKTCHGKHRWLDHLASQSGALSKTNHKSIKLVMPEDFVRNSQVVTWVHRMGLKLNEDVKLSMNVWYRLVTPQTSIGAFQEPRQQGYDCCCCYSARSVSYCLEVLKQLGCNEEGLTLGTISGSETPDELRAALFHLKTTVSHYRRVGMSFMLLFTYRQVELYSKMTEFSKLLHDGGVVVLDELELYLPSLSEKKIRTKMRLLNEVLPAVNKRIAVCGNPAKLEYCKELCKSSIFSSDTTEQSGMKISKCFTRKCCSGILSMEHAVVIKYGKKSPSQTGYYSLKEFEHHVGPFPPRCKDVIFEGFGKFSQARRDEITARALGKLAHVGKLFELNRLAVSVEDGRTTRSRKLCKVEVRLHFHEPCALN